MNNNIQTVNHKQACDYLGINERTLSNKIKEHEIEYKREGREIKYNKSDIDKLKSIISKSMNQDVFNQIIMIGSPKGGTGKTTTVKYISKILAGNRKKVLVVDADPQHYYTNYAINYLNDEDKARLKENNLLSLLQGKKKLVKVSIPLFENIDFIPCLRALEFYDTELRDVMGRELRIKNSLTPALPHYDYILIDSSPAQSGITMASLMAAHTLIIPVIPDVDSFEAASDLIKSIEKIFEGDLSDKFRLNQIFILPVKQKTGWNSGFHKQVLNDIRNEFRDIDLLTQIKIDILEPVMEYDYIPKESYEGLLNENTKAYQNFYHSIKGVFNL